MGKLAEIKDMEEAVENGSAEAKEFIAFTKRQEEHNQQMQKLMKITAGCVAGVLVVVVVAAVMIVPRALGILSDAKTLTAQAQQTLADTKQVVEQVKAGNPKEVMDNFNNLTKEGEVALQECVEQIKKAVEVLEKVDIDSLNTAVENLGKAVSPLARLFGGR